MYNNILAFVVNWKLTDEHLHTYTHLHLFLQIMVNSEVSGVAFSRHPLTPLSSNTVLVEAVYGLGEGLVSGELEADRYEVWEQIINTTCIIE